MTDPLCNEVFASLADPNISITPVMYNAAFRHYGWDRCYVSFSAPDLPAALSAVRVLALQGLSVSRPHKTAILPLLDQVDATAATIGAVNCVTNVNGALKGYNSDWIGAVGALGAKTPLRGAMAVVLGSGGAGRAVTYGLLAEGATVLVHNRTARTAEAVARQLGARAGSASTVLDAVSRADVVINATSVGDPLTRPDGRAVASALRPGQTVLDVAFGPQGTPFASEAASVGCEVIDGAEMLLRQAFVAFQIFTGQSAPEDVMRQALQDRLASAGR